MSTIDPRQLLAELKADPRFAKLIDASVANAREAAADRGLFDAKGDFVLKSDTGDKCGGCFVCLACAATPTPDIEAACLVTAIHAA